MRIDLPRIGRYHFFLFIVNATSLYYFFFYLYHSAAIRQSDSYHAVAKVFEEYIHSIENYFGFYIERAEDAQKLRKMLIQKNDRFESFCKIGEFCLRAKLDALQSEPVQRRRNRCILIQTAVSCSFF